MCASIDEFAADVTVEHANRIFEMTYALTVSEMP